MGTRRTPPVRVRPDRRRFMGLSVAGLAGLSVLPTEALAVASAVVRPPDPSDVQAAANVTRRLANYVVSAKYGELPAPVRKEARRTLLNWLGCALGGSQHETVDAVLSALAPFSGPRQATIVGRRERMDI